MSFPSASPSPDPFVSLPSLSEVSLFHAFLPSLCFMAVTLGFCYLPAYAPPWPHPLYSFSIFSSVKYDPSPIPPIIFLLSALHAAVLFSLVLWFQLRAFLLSFLLLSQRSLFIFYLLHSSPLSPKSCLSPPQVCFIHLQFFQFPS